MRKLLLANRGEIAVRVIAACRELGLATVAVFAPTDRGALHVRMADEAVELAGQGPAETYCNAEALVDAARSTGADAVHPGYGFLAERGAFARAVEAAGLTFVGPRPETLDLLGDKTAATSAARDNDLPALPRSDGLNDEAAVRAAADELGYPVLVKSPFGGGGLGCRRADDAAAVAEAYAVASSQGRNLYGDPVVFVERCVEKARHIEVQTLGDGTGTVVVLGDRECSIQRRRQKVVEEAPAQNLSPELRRNLHEAARRLTSALQLRSAATVEFLVEGEAFWFLEVNPRIQVEHPVTEAVFGIDLVRWQLRLAGGEPLTLPDGLTPRGYALEGRIYAEDPTTFAPCPGTVHCFRPPSGPGIRVDAGVETGSVVTALYDPLLAKLVCWDADKARACTRMVAALDRFALNGDLVTNVELRRHVVAAAWFRDGDYDTTTLERRPFRRIVDPATAELAALLAARFGSTEVRAEAPASASGWNRTSWRSLP